LNSTDLYGKPISKLRSVTFHMGLHSVYCHLPPVAGERACLNPSQTGRYSIYAFTPEE